jgi:hypothetical protein
VKAERQCEVSEVIRREMQLVSLSGPSELGDLHDVRVVDEDVERAAPGSDEAVDRRAVGELQRRGVRVRASRRGHDVGDDFPARVQIARGDRDVRAGAGQCASGLDADTR